MTRAIIYLNSPRELEFKRQAKKLGSRYEVSTFGAKNGQDLCDISDHFEDGSVEHMIILCHGFTNRFLHSRGGVHRTRSSLPSFVSAMRFADFWSGKLTTNAKLSLAACMCGRSPRWHLRDILGGIPGIWSAHSHSDGGKASIAAKVRDSFAKHGAPINVRAHTVPGHMLYAAPMRDFHPDVGEEGASLFRLIFPGVPLKWRNIVRYNKAVKGRLAEDLLLFEDDAIPNIQARLSF